MVVVLLVFIGEIRIATFVNKTVPIQSILKNANCIKEYFFILDPEV